jgi:hypothetical protein
VNEMTISPERPGPTAEQLDEMVRATEPRILANLFATTRSRSRRVTWASATIAAAALIVASVSIATHVSGGSASPEAPWALSVTCFDRNGTALNQVLLSEAPTDPRLVCASLRAPQIVYGAQGQGGLPQQLIDRASSWVACTASTNSIRVYQSAAGRTAPNCTLLKLHGWEVTK